MKELFHRLLAEAGRICLLGHTNPDGDCLGSTLGLRQYIGKRYPGKDVQVYLMEANEKFAYLPGFSDICHTPQDAAYDLAILCDCADLERLGDFRVLAEGAAEHFIADHHVTSEPVYAHALIRPDASSASEVVFDLLDREYIDWAAATCLYTGIVHDTGVFKYNATSPHTMEIAGFLMGKGIDFGSIIDDGFFMKTYAQQQVQAKVLLESTRLLGGRVLAGTLDQKEMRFYGVGMRDIDGIVPTMRETRGIDVAVFLYEVKKQTYKCSLRSNNRELDVARVASRFGGGGHKMAAGCSLSGEKGHVMEMVLQELTKQLDAPGFHSNCPAFAKAGGA